jgi:hypothetical protein
MLPLPSPPFRRFCICAIYAPGTGCMRRPRARRRRSAPRGRDGTERDDGSGEDGSGDGGGDGSGDPPGPPPPAWRYGDAGRLSS